MTKPARVTVPLPAVITVCQRCREEIVLRPEDRPDAHWTTALSWRGRRRVLDAHGKLVGWSLLMHPFDCKEEKR